MAPKRKSTVKESPQIQLPDWGSMTVVQLKSQLESRNMDVVGKKADLIKRLQEAHDVSNGESKTKKSKPDSPPKTGIQKAIEQLKTSKTATPATVKVFKIDQSAINAAPGTYQEVHEDCSFMLNQTNIGHNNNKFYIGQLLQRNDGLFDVFTKWGRVGESGQELTLGPAEFDAAFASFEKKFTDKTGNKWENRADFKPKAGKYHLIETEADDAEEAEETPVAQVGISTNNLTTSGNSSLDKITREMVSLIFDTDMFNDAMQKLNLDTKKMPLGKLSKAQIARGFEALEKIESRLKNPTTTADLGTLTELSNEFYTVIPHDFKRTRPPTIGDLSLVQEKFDMLITLGDIEIAQELQRQQPNAEADLHPCDVKYGQLKCQLKLLDPKSKEYKALEKYFESTKYPGSRMKLRHIWSVNRESDDARFQLHDDIQNRKLLWHGTNVAVVAAILKTGLRIMPHSGGRVGRGIYFASEHGKSAGYTQPAKGTGLMFLNEVALGNEHEILRDNSSFRQAPAGYDSVVARGQQEPDRNLDINLKFNGKDVTIPQGVPKPMPQYSGSSFSQSEYLVYRESQVRIRYLLDFDFTQR